MKYRHWEILDNRWFSLYASTDSYWGHDSFCSRDSGIREHTFSLGPLHLYWCT